MREHNSRNNPVATHIDVCALQTKNKVKTARLAHTACRHEAVCFFQPKNKASTRADFVEILPLGDDSNLQKIPSGMLDKFVLDRALWFSRHQACSKECRELGRCARVRAGATKWDGREASTALAARQDQLAAQ